MVGGACDTQAVIAAGSSTTTGTIGGMPSHKTTVYLPSELKVAIEREARRRVCSEAQVIRDAIAAAVSRPKPTIGLIDGPPLAEDAERLLAGFGER